MQLCSSLTYTNNAFCFVDFEIKTEPCVKGYNGGYGGGGGQGCNEGGGQGGYGGSISCGVGKQSRIVGGTRAKPVEFPWQVGFRWETSNSRTNIFCGGSLIDKKWVVSAAHCFQRMNPPPDQLKVVLGEFDVRNEEGNEVVIAARRVSLEDLFTIALFHKLVIKGKYHQVVTLLQA